MGVQGREVLCMEHSGLCVSIKDVKEDVDYIKDKTIPAIEKSITDLKVYIAKVTCLALGAMIALEKVGFLR